MVLALISIAVPALSSARRHAHRDRCADNLARLGNIWHGYLADHDDEFPYLPIQGAWRYGGARVSSVSGEPFLDPQRPLTPFVGGGRSSVRLFHCPADTGIQGELPGTGTGRRSAFEAFGTSYRGNDILFDARRAGAGDVYRGVRIAELLTVPTRLVVLGTPNWFEVREATGRSADWHGEPGWANLLFLDGSVKYSHILPKSRPGPAVFDARLRTPDMQREWNVDAPDA